MDAIIEEELVRDGESDSKPPTWKFIRGVFCILRSLYLAIYRD